MAKPVERMKHMELTERVKMADEKETVEVTAEQQFDAYAIIASDKYRRYHDLLNLPS